MLLKLLKQHNIEVIAYADDFLLILGGNTRTQLEAAANNALSIFNNWLQQVGLQASPQKTLATIYGKLKRNPIFKLNGTNIKIVKHFRYLGVIIDCKLTWLPHLNYLQIKAKQLQSSISKLATNTWGIPAHLLKLWYSVVAERIFCYGAGCWGHNITKAMQKKLLSLQRSFMLRITRAYHTTPTAALNVLTGLAPLPLVIEAEAKRTSILQLQSDISINNTIYKPSEVQIKIPKWTLHPSYTLTNLRHLPLNDTEDVKTTIRIFTDGSKTTSGVAAAFVAYEYDQCIAQKSGKLSQHNSVFQAEVYAIKLAVQWASHDCYPEATIYTDSRSSYDALLQHRPPDPQIKDLQTIISHSTTLFHLAWVKAHAGNTGNEAADELARQTTYKPDLDQSLPLPVSHIKKILRQDTTEKWQLSWDTSDTGRTPYKFLPKVKKDYQCSHRFLIMCITGHGPFPAYLHRFHLADSPNCLCGEVGTPLHYLSFCPLTSSQHILPPSQGYETVWMKEIKKRSQHRARVANIVQRLMREGHLFTAQ